MNDLFLKAAMAYYEQCENKKKELANDLKEKHVPHYLGVSIMFKIKLDKIKII